MTLYPNSAFLVPLSTNRPYTHEIRSSRYSPVYSKMGAHPDQALDLAQGSSIAIFSCYRDPKLPPRTLVIKSKDSDDVFERDLMHQSAIVFSVDANQR